WIYRVAVFKIMFSKRLEFGRRRMPRQVFVQLPETFLIAHQPDEVQLRTIPELNAANRFDAGVPAKPDKFKNGGGIVDVCKRERLRANMNALFHQFRRRHRAVAK